MMHERLFKLEREAEMRVHEARDREIDRGGPGSGRRASEAMDAPMLEVAAIRKMRQRLGDKQTEIDHQKNLLRRTDRNPELPRDVKRYRAEQAGTKLATLEAELKALEAEAEQVFFPAAAVKSGQTLREREESPGDLPMLPDMELTQTPEHLPPRPPRMNPPPPATDGETTGKKTTVSDRAKDAGNEAVDLETQDLALPTGPEDDDVGAGTSAQTRKARAMSVWSHWAAFGGNPLPGWKELPRLDDGRIDREALKKDGDFQVYYVVDEQGRRSAWRAGTRAHAHSCRTAAGSMRSRSTACTR